MLYSVYTKHVYLSILFVLMSSYEVCTLHSLSMGIGYRQYENKINGHSKFGFSCYIFCLTEVFGQFWRGNASISILTGWIHYVFEMEPKTFSILPGFLSYRNFDLSRLYYTIVCITYYIGIWQETREWDDCVEYKSSVI